MKNTLTIAGSDTCGGAGIQADLKTFSAHGTYGMSVITAVTVQNTMGVFGCQDIDADIISAQIDAIFEDIFHVDAVKVGMVSKTETINAIADKKQYQKASGDDDFFCFAHNFFLSALILDGSDISLKSRSGPDVLLL